MLIKFINSCNKFTLRLRLKILEIQANKIQINIEKKFSYFKSLNNCEQKIWINDKLVFIQHL